MNIFPHIITRIGGASFEHFIMDDKAKLNTLFEIYIQLKEQLKSKKIALSDVLLEFNKEIDEHRLRNIVQNVRRDIFNERSINENDIRHLNERISVPVQHQMREYFTFKEKVENCKAEFKIFYYNCQDNYRLRIKELAQASFLQKGLLLSSNVLFNRVEYYLSSDSSNFRKDTNNIEQSLYKYISRSCSKTTPFSTFNNLACSSIVQNLNTPLVSTTDTVFTDKVKSNIRLNSMIYKYIRELLLRIPNLKDEFLLRANPTIEAVDENFHYLINNNNVEAFQQMAIDPVNSVIVKRLTESDVVTYASLLSNIASLTESSELAVMTYLDNLIDYGLVEFHIPISGLDPEWDKKFLSYLNSVFGDRVEVITELKGKLENIRTIAEKYEEVNVEERRELLQEAFSQLKEMAVSLHAYGNIKFVDSNTKLEETPQKEADSLSDDIEKTGYKKKGNSVFRFKPENIFYEDTYRDVSFHFNSQDIQEFVKKMSILLDDVALPDIKRIDQDKAKKIFLSKFEAKESVTFLDFYKQFSKEILSGSASASTEEQARKLDNKVNPAEIINEHTHTEKQGLRELWQRKVKELMGNDMQQRSEQFRFNSVDLDGLLEQKSDRKSSYCSHSAYVQFYVENNSNGKPFLMGVLNGHAEGFGKTISRFLYIFDKELANDLKVFNEILTDSSDTVFAEACDASFFNANIHPSFINFELDAPGSNINPDTPHKIKISDLTVGFCSKDDRLYLSHKNSNRRICPLDLGLQSIMWRSKLFQLLTLFNNSRQVLLNPFLGIINGSFDQTQEVVDKVEMVKVYPRVVFDDQIVIQRKRWVVPARSIPEREKLTDEFDFYLFINEWRRILGIPDEIFIKVDTSAEPDKNNSEPDKNNSEPDKNNTESDKRNNLLKAQSKNDDRKPQYVDFMNPLCVKVFEKLAKRAAKPLIIEEMLPTSDQLLSINGKKYVTEFIVNWNDGVK